MKQKKNRIYLLTLSVITVFFALPLKAQVTIGDNVDPHIFSILELVTKNKDGGLRLPQLTTRERDDVAKQWTALDPESEIAKAAQGLVIYNTDTNCLEFWNGKEWISLCSDALDDCSTVSYPEVNASYDFVAGATIADLIAAIGGNVKLYDEEIDGDLYDNPSALLVAGSPYYAEQRVGNCSRRVPVAVTISTDPVSGSVTIDACVNTMYDIQYQILTAYGTTGGAATQWQWYAKRRGENDSEYKPIPDATAVSYKIPTKFVQDVFRKMKNESSTDYNDSVVFKVEVWNAGNTTRISSTTVFDVEFIDTYGNDYVALKAPPSITGNTNTGEVIKIAYLNLGVEPDADGYNACDFGSLYQWGRITDGHEKIGWTKAAVGGNIAFDAETQNNRETNNLTAADYDSNPPALAGDGALPFYQVTNADYKDKFLFGNSNWNTDRTDYQFFWATSSYAKTSNDPCPFGWHVPTRFEFGAIFQGTPTSSNPGTATNLNNAWTWRPNTGNRIAGGYIVAYGDGSDTSRRIFLPAAGYRSYSAGTLTNAGRYGGYWSSTNYDAAAAYNMTFYSGGVEAGDTSLTESFGYSVRCIAE